MLGRTESSRNTIWANLQTKFRHASQTENRGDESTLVGDERLWECAVASIQVAHTTRGQKVKVLHLAVGKQQAIFKGGEGHGIRRKRGTAKTRDA
jgi:hypothetical protein